MKYKINDRVKVVHQNGSAKTLNQIAVIKQIIKHPYMIELGLEFNKFIDGHNGYWGGKAGYCWMVDAKDVVLAETVWDIMKANLRRKNVNKRSMGI